MLKMVVKLLALLAAVFCLIVVFEVTYSAHGNIANVLILCLGIVSALWIGHLASTGKLCRASMFGLMCAMTIFLGKAAVTTVLLRPQPEPLDAVTVAFVLITMLLMHLIFEGVNKQKSDVTKNA